MLRRLRSRSRRCVAGRVRCARRHDAGLRTARRGAGTATSGLTGAGAEPPRPSDPAAIEASALSAFRAAECNPAVTITDRAAALTYLRAATASDAARAAKRRQILGWLP